MCFEAIEEELSALKASEKRVASLLAPLEQSEVLSAPVSLVKEGKDMAEEPERGERHRARSIIYITYNMYIYICIHMYIYINIYIYIYQIEATKAL